MGRCWGMRGCGVRRRDTQWRPEFDAVEDRLLLSAGLKATTPAPQKATVPNQAAFVLNTYENGRSMAASGAVRKVGLSYAKVAFSHDAQKVGLAYARAVIRGNGETINQLGKTSAVKRLGDSFTKLSHSTFVKKVGDAFASFGRSVADQFDHLFLHHDSTPAKTKAKPRVK